jgi:hypothetical protein
MLYRKAERDHPRTLALKGRGETNEPELLGCPQNGALLVYWRCSMASRRRLKICHQSAAGGEDQV